MRCLRAESFLTFMVNNAPYGVRGRVVPSRSVKGVRFRHAPVPKESSCNQDDAEQNYDVTLATECSM